MKPSKKRNSISGSTAKRTVRILKTAMNNGAINNAKKINMANYSKGMAYLMKMEEDKLDLMIASASS